DISNKNDVHSLDSDMSADDGDHLSNDSGHNAKRPRNGDVDLELKRQRNRDAAARHRLRQQRRLDGLAKKEEILRQQVEEIQLEINTMRSGRLGLPAPSRDRFTDTVLELSSSVGELKKALTMHAQDCLSLTDEVRRDQASCSKVERPFYAWGAAKSDPVL
ncbi:hypothetical protein EC988_002540, partial [Linderina pennispora]